MGPARSVCSYVFQIFWFFFHWQNEGKDVCEEPERPGAIISNHVSYIDILYHMSSFFPSFVAKVYSFGMLNKIHVTYALLRNVGWICFYRFWCFY